MGAGHPKGGDQAGSQNLQRVESEEERRRGPGEGGGRRGDPAPGAREACGHPLSSSGDGNRGRLGGGALTRRADRSMSSGLRAGGWVAHGLHRERGPGAAHAPAPVIPLPPSPLLPIGGSWGAGSLRTIGAGRGRSRREDQPTDVTGARPRGLQPEPPASPAQAQSGAHPEGGRERDAGAPVPPSSAACAGAGEGERRRARTRGPREPGVKEVGGGRGGRGARPPAGARARRVSFPFPVFALSLPHSF